MDPTASTRTSAAPFWRARIGSLLGVLPLAVWTAIHLWNNLYGFEGAEAWERQVTGTSSRLLQALVMILVLGSLLWHALWGLGRIAIGRVNNAAYGNYANLKFLLQRVSALGVLAFLGAHLWLALVRPRLTEGHPERFADIAHEMHHHGPTLVVYLLGTLGVAFHLANGVETLLMKVGMRWPRRFADRLEQPFLALFLVLLAMSWASIYALYRAGA